MDLNPLSPSQIDPIVMVAIALIFIATYFALQRVFVRPYLAVMEERERLFESGDEMLDRADLVEEQAIQGADATIAAAAEAAEGLRTSAQQDAEEYRRERIDAATSEASMLLESGRAEIISARTEHSVKLRTQVEDCVGLECDRLLGTHDPEVVEAAVDRLMSRGTG